MNEFKDFLETLKQPEYIHVLLNPLPVYGLGMALLVFIIGSVVKSRGVQAVGLVLILLTCASGWIVEHYGEEGYDRVEAMVSEKEKAWLDAHKERGERAVWVLYAEGLVAILGLIALGIFPRAMQFLGTAAIIVGLAAFFMTVWTAHAGGKIRHKEFYEGPPPGYEKAKQQPQKTDDAPLPKSE
ncbi:hypothetical protein [Methylacidiphilum caldifontis]|uniref:Uncharacterized protein n=1 Tax=Methylacidiphilum caldifontis TaxID=2795386 RepID=A0A4Y8PHY1_9BACT|nr:hypothetical protein [Methylacidiphilum caldifontis]QSR89655.1 hypothetical protein IT6_05170 [Methylacidiphilum caldifontis]TFE73396.1 hypothetical protein A7Q10_00070 [Methylacidiphilum caldifontis]